MLDRSEIGFRAEDLAEHLKDFVARLKNDGDMDMRSDPVFKIIRMYQINAIMDEAKFFALTDNIVDFDADIKSVRDWI